MAVQVAGAQIALLLMKDGTIRLAVDDARTPNSKNAKVQRALLRWLRDFPEHTLNECDHVPMVCATYNKPGEKPCGACAVRKALGWPGLKPYRPLPEKQTTTAQRETEKEQK